MANINVKVNADTSTARQALQDLQRQLDQLSNPTKLTNSTISSELMKAAQAAEILKTQLEQATNVNTGRLDLTKFTQQLSQSGMSLEKYQQYFKQFGTDGQKAFTALASSIAQAEIPLKNMNSMTQKMWTSIKNTINWQISSSLIHGIVGQFSTMVNYAKDLDKSLNNIQIVTGASAQKMTQFAQQANQAAKQLNTTTTAYTNASLIYYQQGLSDKEVKARTDVTVKLANVTKESVTDVSNQLTAIWNNFAEGSGNLEHFADVITALGAATASSSKEIATGLEKFASIADTVGLSYEKATAALATVTAKTRQSADTVGTGFRTIFSRLQSLSLGETLEDGVNLTKYTKALKTVGVQALDTSGNLRSMDNIIMDVGEKWEKLTDSQKMAFANTVGGVRQYATLVALFDDFDQFKANLSIAETSDGTLQNQADIYAESWEAAGKRVRATAEGIYGRLVNSDDMTTLMDGFAKFLEIIQGIIDGLGGLSGVLVTLGAIATNVFSKQISTGLSNMGTSLMTMTKAGRERLAAFQMNAVQMGMSEYPTKGERDAAMKRSYTNQGRDNLAYLAYGQNFNESQSAIARNLMEYNRQYYQAEEQAGADLAAAQRNFNTAHFTATEANYKKAIQDAEKEFLKNEVEEAGELGEEARRNLEAASGTEPSRAEFLQKTGYLQQNAPTAQSVFDAQQQILGRGRADDLAYLAKSAATGDQKALAQWETMREGIKARYGTDENGNINYEAFLSGLDGAKDSAMAAAKALDELATATKAESQAKTNEEKQAASGQKDAAKTAANTAGETLTDDLANKEKPVAGVTPTQMDDLQAADRHATNTAGAAAQRQAAYEDWLKQQQNRPLTGGEAISKIAGAATAAASAVMMLSNAFKVLGDDSATGSQKLGAVVSMIMGLGTAIPAVTGLIESMGKKVVIAGTEMSLAMWQVTLIAAAIAAIGVGIGYIISKTDTDEKQLKRATESARELQDNYKAATDYSKSLKDAFSNYDSVADTLNNCVKYSDEWYAALENIRSAVLDILQEFPELAQFGDALEWDEDLGGYKLNEDVRKQATEAAEQNELVAKAAALEGQNNLNILKTQQQAKTALSTASKQAYKDILSSDKMSYTIGSGDDAKSNSFAIGTVLSNWLSALTVDQLQELKASGFKEELATQIGSSKEFASYVSEYNQDHGTNYTTDSLLKSIDTELIQFSNNYTKNGGIDELIEAQKQEDLQETAQFNRDRLIASNTLKDQGYSALETDMAARAYRENVDKKEADILSILKAPGRAGTADNWGNLNPNFTKIIEDYIKSSNGKYTQAVLDDVISVSGAQRYINLQTASGVENVRIETIASTVAAQRALEEMGDSAITAKTKLETFDNNFKDTFGSQDKAGTLNSSMKNFMATGGLGNEITKDSLKLLRSTIADSFDEDSGAFLQQMFGVDDTNKDDYAKSLGYKNFDELVNQFTTAQTNMSKALRTSIDDIDKLTEYKIDDKLLNNLNLDQLSLISKTFKNISQYGTSDLFLSFQELLTSQTSTEDLIKLVDALQNTDWTSTTALNDFKTAIAGVQLPDNFNIDGFVAKITEMESLANGLDITGFITTMQKVQNLLSSVNNGTIISKEDFEAYQRLGYNFTNLGYTDTSGQFIVTANTTAFRQNLNTQTAGINQNKLDLAQRYKEGTMLVNAEDFYNATNGDLTAAFEKALLIAGQLGATSDQIKEWRSSFKTDLTADWMEGTKDISFLQGEIDTLLREIVDLDAEQADRDATYDQIVRSVAENMPNLAELDKFLANEKYSSELKDILEDTDGSKIQALRESTVLRYASMMGMDTTAIAHKGHEYYEDKVGIYSTTGYNTLADAEQAVVHEQELLQQANSLALDTTRLQKEAEEIWFRTQDHSGFTSYTDALEAIINKEAGLYSFRQGMIREAADWNINYDNVIEYAKQLREIGEFNENDIEASERYALALLNQNAAIETIKANYAEWIKILNDAEAAPLDQKQAFNDLQNALKQLFNLAKKDPISDQLMDWAKQTGNLKKLIDGDKKAWGEALAEQAKGLVQSGKLTDELTKKINEFTASMAKKKKGEIVSDDEVAKAKELVKAAGDNLTDEQKGNLFKSLTNAEGDFGFNENGELVKHINVQIDNGDDAQAKLQAIADSIPEGETRTLTIQVVQDGELTSKPLTIEGGADISGKFATSGALLGDDGGEISGSYSVQGNVENPVVVSKGTGGGKGGGGGGGGKKEPHKIKRYRNITNQIQNNQRKTDSTSRKKDRAFGTEKLDLLKQERDLREENLKLQQQYQSEIEDWLVKDKQDMMDAFAAINFTPIFDEFGEVINNDEFEAAFHAIGDGSNEAWKKAEEALAQYEETLDLLNDQLVTIEELQEQIFDSFLEQTKLEVDLHINVSNDNLEYLDYLLSKLEDNAYAAAEAISLLGQKADETMTDIKTYQQGIADILSRHKAADGTTLTLENIGSMSAEDLKNAGFTQDEIDTLRDYRSQLLEANQTLLELRKTVTDKVIDSLDKLNEEVQKSYDNFDHYNSVLENYKNINDLINVGNSKLSKDIMNKLNRAQLTNAQNAARSAKDIFETAKLNMANAQAAYQAALATNDQGFIDEQKKILDAVTEDFQDAENQWLESWQTALEQAKTIFEAAMEDVVDSYNQAMGGAFGSLDYLQQAYDRQKETNDQYLQDYDRLYELSKLSRDISKSIDDTDSIKGKERLRALQAEINELQANGNKLSEYDINALQKKFELEKARLALEDAENAKQTVRLQRDAEGNWGYVYTADEDKVAEAEQEYEDKLHEYQELNDEYIQELQDKALEAQATYRDLINEIMSDTTLSDSERQARLDEAKRWYDEQINFFGQQLTNALNNQNSTLDRYYSKYNDERAQLVDSWNETTLAMLTGTGDLDSYMQQMRNSASNMVQAAWDALTQLKTDINNTNDEVNPDSSFTDAVTGAVSTIGALSDSTASTIHNLSDAVSGEFVTALDAAVRWEQNYINNMAGMISQNEAFVTSLNNMIAALSGVDTTGFYNAANTTAGAAGNTKDFGNQNYDTSSGIYASVNYYNPDIIKKIVEDSAINEIMAANTDLATNSLISLDEILSYLDLQTNAFEKGLGYLQAIMVQTDQFNMLQQNVHIDATFPEVTEHTEIEEALNNLINRAAQYANRKT